MIEVTLSPRRPVERPFVLFLSTRVWTSGNLLLSNLRRLQLENVVSVGTCCAILLVRTTSVAVRVPPLGAELEVGVVAAGAVVHSQQLGILRAHLCDLLRAFLTHHILTLPVLSVLLPSRLSPRVLIHTCTSSPCFVVAVEA